MEDLSVMIVGGGAREHALSNAYEKSPQVKRVIVAPGNDFIGYGREKDVVIDGNCSLKNPESIVALAKKYGPDFVDVAQDDALASGVVGALWKAGFPAFGPRKSAARIEWDKRWAREFMGRHGIPQPEFRYFDSTSLAKDFAEKIYRDNPNRLVYVKAAGLCSGKGALKTTSLEEAVANIEAMKSFAGAGKVFLIEEGLAGEEFSYYAISDGKVYRIFKSAQDNKTVFNFDEGDQTGGMGVVSPAMITKGIEKEIEKEMIAKVVNGMAAENNPYVGMLYLGGIVTEGGLMNIEYNARWGDPECQAVLPSLENDYVDVIKACLEGRLNEVKIRQDNKTRVCVVGASRGYPGDYSNVKGKRIYGLEQAMKIDGVTVVGAGVDVRDGNFYANGGRLFSVIGEGNNILEAKGKAYSAMAGISIKGNSLHYRTDIGWRDVERFNKSSD